MVYNEEEVQAVCKTFIAHFGNFGRRPIRKILLERGINISERRISKILKKYELVSKYGRKRGKNVYTSENTEKYIKDNLFALLSKEERSEKNIWSMDFTEQKIGGKKIFTCAIISVAKKMIVGFSQGYRCTAALAIEAVKKAIKEFGVPDMIMTDRGTQFTSKEFYDIMQENKIEHSMSRPHTPVDNIFIETFWKTMKTEIGQPKAFSEDQYFIVVEYYMHYYNYLRPHSTLNYKAPLAA